MNSGLKAALAALMLVCISGCQIRHMPDSSVPFDLSIAETLPESVEVLADATWLAEVDWRKDILPICDDYLCENRIALRMTLPENTAFSETMTLGIGQKYYRKVSVMREFSDGRLSQVDIQNRYQDMSDSVYSGENYAFTLPAGEPIKALYILIESKDNRLFGSARITLVPQSDYLAHDQTLSLLFVCIYSIILTLVIINFAFYIFIRDKAYLIYSLYMGANLYSLIWQERGINKMPWLNLELLGEYSFMAYFIISNVLALVFFMSFLNLKVRESLAGRVVYWFLLFNIAMLFISLVVYHLFYPRISMQPTITIYNLSLFASGGTVIAIAWKKFAAGNRQAGYLLAAWGVFVATIIMRLVYIFMELNDVFWLVHGLEIGIMMEGMILAFALADRSMQFRKERDAAYLMYSEANKAQIQEKMINQYHTEMQELISNSFLSSEQIRARIQSGFFDIMSKALPMRQLAVIHCDDAKSRVQVISAEHADDLQLGLETHLVTLAATCRSSKAILFNSGELLDDQLGLVPVQNRQCLLLVSDGLLNKALLEKAAPYCQAAFAAHQYAVQMHRAALQANLDKMTGALNRESIEAQIRVALKALQGDEKLAVAFVDIDRFKGINDNYGHLVGDEAIVAFSDLLHAHLKGVAKIGRIGGDEFLLLIEPENCRDIERVLNAFIKELSEARLTSENLSLTTSIGVAFSSAGDDLMSITRNADKALYISKENGRNQVNVYEKQVAGQSAVP